MTFIRTKGIQRGKNNATTPSFHIRDIHCLHSILLSFKNSYSILFILLNVFAQIKVVKITCNKWLRFFNIYRINIYNKQRIKVSTSKPTKIFNHFCNQRNPKIYINTNTDGGSEPIGIRTGCDLLQQFWKGIRMEYLKM